MYSRLQVRCCTSEIVSLRVARAKNVALIKTQITVDAGKTRHGEAQVSYIHMIPKLSHTLDQAVLWLDISVNDILGMNILKPIHELVGEHQHCFGRELTDAKVEELSQT